MNLLIPIIFGLFGYFLGNYATTKNIKDRIQQTCIKVTGVDLTAGSVFDHIQCINYMNEDERNLFFQLL